MSFLNKLVCHYHPETVLIEDDHAGDLICPECGLVVGDRVIDVSSEWRTFGKADSNRVDPNRCGGTENPLLSGSSNLTTIIGPCTGPASLTALGGTKYQSRQQISNRDQNLLAAFREITAMANRINLPDSIVDRANHVYKQLQGCIRLRSRSVEAKASACLYLACRQEGAPRTFKEICAISTVSKKEIGRCFRLVLRELEAKVDNITSADFMSRFCANLELPRETQRAATEIANRAAELDLVPGRSPISVAAAAIYMASQASECKKSEKDISEIAGVAPMTIRQSYRALLPHAVKLFPENFCFATPIGLLPIY